ncbi:MAG: hypothetical protein H7834_04885 [Magnetococcus sp. YQC-9]
MWMGNADQNKRELLDLWRGLAPEEQSTLLRFGRFLQSERAIQAPPVEPVEVPVTPLAIARPEVESAVAGLKRLKRTYPMIEADEKLLSEASRILMGKVMGVPDCEVIDQLETFFAGCYQKWCADRLSRPAGVQG